MASMAPSVITPPVMPNSPSARRAAHLNRPGGASKQVDLRRTLKDLLGQQREHGVVHDSFMNHELHIHADFAVDEH
jgi:hypothetical protein